MEIMKKRELLLVKFPRIHKKLFKTNSKLTVRDIEKKWRHLLFE
jgi:hypothetical protein